MDDTTGHDTTDATDRDATAAVLVVSVAEAAALLGISTGAVRKRLERGQLAGRKVGSQWRVVIGEGGAARRDATNATDATRLDAAQSHATGRDTTRQDSAAQQDTTGVAVNQEARAQLEAIRDEWLAPLVTTIQQQAETIGRVTAERDAASAARDEASSERDRLRTERDADRDIADQLVDVLQRERDQYRLERDQAVQGAGRSGGSRGSMDLKGGWPSSYLSSWLGGSDGMVSLLLILAEIVVAVALLPAALLADRRVYGAIVAASRGATVRRVALWSASLFLGLALGLLPVTYLAGWAADAGAFFTWQNLERAGWISTVIAAPVTIVATFLSVRRRS